MKARKLLTPLRWIALEKLGVADFIAQYTKDGREKEFSDDFFDRVQERTNYLEKQNDRITVISTIVLLSMLLSKVGIDSSVGLLGLTIERIDKYQLYFISIYSTLYGVSTIFGGNVRHRKNTMKALYLACRGEEMEGIYRLRWGGLWDWYFPNIPSKFKPNLNPTLLQLLFYFISVVLVSMFLIMLIFILFVPYIYLMVDEFLHPSLQGSLFWALYIYSAFAYGSTSLLFVVSAAPLPFRDTSLLEELARLEKEDNEAYQRKIEELAEKLR